MRPIKPAFQVYKYASEDEREDVKCKSLEQDLSHTMHCGRRRRRKRS